MIKSTKSASARSVKTSLSLNKTRPLKENKIRRLKKNLARQPQENKDKPAASGTRNSARPKQSSRLDLERKMELWLIPARVGFLLNGIYFISFSLVSFLGVFSGLSLIKPFFTLPFETSFSSSFLLEIAALFSFLGSLLYFYAARHPWRMRWFYFLLILLVLPYHFYSNWQKMLIELPRDFLNYLYFDTILMAVIWVCLLCSIYPYLKHKQQS